MAHQAVRPIAIARQPHDLPSFAVDRKSLRTGKTAIGIETNRMKLPTVRMTFCG
jgi:hypothetical protein